jgi:hypothetical protein
VPPIIQRQEMPEEPEEELRIGPEPADLQRQELPEEEEEALQMQRDEQRVGPEGGKVPPTVESAINRARGAGQPLENALQEQMSASLGHDFKRVRVHTGAEADALNQQLQARAFATGQDIFFRQGEYRPGASSGRYLIAHELGHVVQQAQGRVKPTMQLKDGVPVNDDQGLEHEADVMGAKALAPTAQRKQLQAIADSRIQSPSEPLQFKSPGPEATPLFYDQDPQAHPEYGLYHALMASLGFPGNIIDHTWSLLLQGFREQDFIQHQLEQLQYGEGVQISQDLRNIIRNDNICFQEVATLMADYLSVGDTPLALWSGGIDLSPYAHRRGFMPLEETPLGMVVNQIEFHQQWILQAPLWNILSTVFVRQQPPSVHVFLRTFEADAVLFRQEVPIIREIFPDMPIFWHAIYTLEDGTMLEINDNLALEEAWQGFVSQDLCVQTLLDFYLENPNRATERGLDTILKNLPSQGSDYV